MSKVLNDHNGGVSENTFLHHFSQLSQLKKQASAIAGKIRAQKQQAKDDGIDVPLLESAVKFQGKATEEQVKEYNTRLLYMRFLKIPVAQTMDYVPDNFSEDINLTDEQRREKWHNDGFTAGIAGENRDTCPHDPNADAGRVWIEGYEAGQAKLASGIKPLKKEKAEDPDKGKAADKGKAPKHEPEVEEAGKKKRGRPAKAKGVSYWHNEGARRVYEVPDSDAPPEGAVTITRKEYDALKAEYDKADEDDWDAGAPDPDEDGDADGEPPAPDEDDDAA